MPSYKAISAFLRSTPTGANSIGLLTFFAWLFKAIALDPLTAPFPWMAGVGAVVDGLFSAVIAGYVFYILFALWPDYQARATLAPYVNGKVRRIVGDCLGVLDQTNKASSHQVLFFKASKLDIENSFLAVHTGTPPDLLMGTRPATWSEFLEYRRQRSVEAVRSLIDRARFLEADLVILLTEIEECSYFNMVQMSVGIRVNNPNLGAWSGSFFQYMEKCRALARWHDRHIMSGENAILEQ